MEPTLFDHLLALAFVLGLPLYAALVRAPRMRQAHAEGRPGYRLRAYRAVLVSQWSLVGLTVLLWVGQERPLAALGLSPGAGTGAWVAAGVTLLLLALLGSQGWMAVGDAEARVHIRTATEGIRYLLPLDRRQLNWFTAVSLTAGCCEELLFRGFLLAYATALGGEHVAWVLVTLAFGAGHAYQGLKGIVQTTVLGAVLVALTAGSGSLLPAVLLHAGVDLHSGCLVTAALTDEDDAQRRRTYARYLAFVGVGALLLLGLRVVA